MTNAWPWWAKSKATVFPSCNSWLNFRVRGQFEIKILIVRHINTTYFIWILKKIKLEPAIIWKPVPCQRITSKKYLTSMGRHLSPRYGQVILVSGYPVLTAVNWSKHWCPICVHYQFSCAPKLARKYEIEHWSRSNKTINWSAGSFQINHVTSMSWHMSPRYGQWLSCFDSCQLTILWMSNIKDVDLPRHAWDTPPFLLIVSPTPPVQSVDAYVRTYARSITWQPNEKRLTIFYEYGAVSHARYNWS